jgi:transcriptional regulator with PAS, ATPase and Fis domain
LKQVLMRIMSRHTGERTVTIGSIPSDEWPAGTQRDKVAWLDSNFEQQIHRAVLFGAGLKEIGRAAEEIAIRYAITEEKGNVHRAACRLGVTDRTLQFRRATRRQADDPRGLATTPASDRSGLGSRRGG